MFSGAGVALCSEFAFASEDREAAFWGWQWRTRRAPVFLQVPVQGHERHKEVSRRRPAGEAVSSESSRVLIGARAFIPAGTRMEDLADDGPVGLSAEVRGLRRPVQSHRAEQSRCWWKSQAAWAQVSTEVNECGALRGQSRWLLGGHWASALQLAIGQPKAPGVAGLPIHRASLELAHAGVGCGFQALWPGGSSTKGAEDNY